MTELTRIKHISTKLSTQICSYIVSLLVCFSGGHFADLVKPWLREYHLCRAPIRWESCSRGCLLSIVGCWLWYSCLSTSLPTPTPTLSLPSHPPPCHTHLKNHFKNPEIHPSVIYKVRYGKIFGSKKFGEMK